jgi:hypothetical protein
MSTKSQLQLLYIPILALGIPMACDADLPTSLSLGQRAELPDGTVGNPDPTAGDDPTDEGNDDAASGEENTFNHPDGLGGQTKDPFDALAERQEEGPPEIRTRLHSCQKLQVVALRNLLEALGVDLQASGDPPPAGQLLREGLDALGGAKYAGRVGEAITATNSGSTKMQDIWVMAAAEVIERLPTMPQCQIVGEGPAMFIEDGTNIECNEPAVTCIIGRPASDEHLAICNQLVQSAADVETGKRLAVAALLAGAHTCE